METKICTYCGEEKNIDQYRKSGKQIRGECKKCETLKHKEYCRTHKDTIKRIAHKTYKNNFGKRHKRNIENREKMKEYNKKYYEIHKDYYKEHHKRYSIEHRNQLNQKYIIWKRRNPEKMKEKYKRETIRTKNEPIKYFKLELRNNIRRSFERRNFVKDKHLNEICGCEIDELIEHLIKTYETNYNEKWDWNYLGSIHIDHITPLITAKTKEDVEKLCHYTNLQLLKAEDNLKKGCRT